MITIQLHPEDLPFVLAAINNRANRLLDSVTTQIDAQINKRPPVGQVEISPTPTEVTLTPKRGPGRPKGVKNKAKRRPAKKPGVSK